MKKIITIVLLTILAMGVSQANELEKKKTEIAQKEDLLLIYKDSCSWCKKLKEEIIPKPAIQDILKKRYNLIYLDSHSKDTKIREQVAKLKKKYKYKGLPTYVRPSINYAKSGGREKIFLDFLLYKKEK